MGRKSKLSEVERMQLYFDFTDPERTKTIKELAILWNISVPSIYNYVKRYRQFCADYEQTT